MTPYILGGMTTEEFFSEYWQKKPLLIRKALLEEVAGILEPNDIKQLALEEHITARLIQQHGEQHDQWQVKCSPLSAKDFKKLPPYWTLLVQALDHVSLDIAELWQLFDFLPQWRRDDVMVSYAPKGGSVGKHFDYYDVFLVQAYGQRRWQLGQMCDENTPLVPNQPLKLLPEMDVYFDEVLNVGDLLYVPPGLSHYGVAENDCLTLSFGFRMPNPANMLDRVSDQFADHSQLKNPVIDIVRTAVQDIGEITQDEFQHLKTQLIEKLQHSPHFDTAIMALMSEPKYPNNFSEPEEIGIGQLIGGFLVNCSLMVEPASRLLYRTLENGELEFWANGEKLELNPKSHQIFKALADGTIIHIDNIDFYIDIENLNDPVANDVLNGVNQAILMIKSPDSYYID